MDQEQEVSDDELEQMLDDSMDEFEEALEDLEVENAMVEIRRPGENERHNGQEVVPVFDGDLNIEELEHETSSDNEEEEEEPDQDGQRFDTQLPTQHSVRFFFQA